MLGSKYPVLALFSVVIRGLAILNALSTIYNFLVRVATPIAIPYAEATPEKLQQFGLDFSSTVLGLLGAGLLISLAVYAFGEFIDLAINAEENQRKTINYLRALREMEKEKAISSGIGDAGNVWKPPKT